MHRRQPPPRIWMMTDERQGDRLWLALERLPAGAGVIFRHYGRPATERRSIFEQVRRIAKRRRLMLILAGPPGLAAAWRADGSHGRFARRSRGFRTAPVHNRREIRAAGRACADMLFLSPVHATQSHPGARTLGPLRFGALARQSRIPVVALGGMDAAKARRLVALGAYGWAAVDAWTR